MNHNDIFSSAESERRSIARHIKPGDEQPVVEGRTDEIEQLKHIIAEQRQYIIRLQDRLLRERLKYGADV